MYQSKTQEQNVIKTLGSYLFLAGLGEFLILEYLWYFGYIDPEHISIYIVLAQMGFGLLVAFTSDYRNIIAKIRG